VFVGVLNSTFDKVFLEFLSRLIDFTDIDAVTDTSTSHAQHGKEKLLERTLVCLLSMVTETAFNGSLEIVLWGDN
jgi:hypothetical protein